MKIIVKDNYSEMNCASVIAIQKKETRLRIGTGNRATPIGTYHELARLIKRKV